VKCIGASLLDIQHASSLHSNAICFVYQVAQLDDSRLPIAVSCPSEVLALEPRSCRNDQHKPKRDCWST